MPLFDVQFLQSDGSQTGDTVTIDRENSEEAIDRAKRLAKDMSPKVMKLVVTHEGRLVQDLSL